jgi:DNA topoisomerase II
MVSSSKKYVKLDQREHVLARPGMYIGSIEADDRTTWVCDSEEFVHRAVRFVPGLYKIFDEILVNVLDHGVRIAAEGHVMKEIRVEINTTEGYVEVYNSGPGVDVLMHEEHRVYVPELIFGHMLTSSNYDDNEERIIGGQNGVGAKGCNVFSTRFDIDTIDKTRGLRYEQSFYDNMSRRDDPKITKCKRLPYTRIRFYPDLKRFGMESLEDDIVALMVRRTYDVSALTSSTTKVYLNNNLINCKSFERYADKFLGASRTETPRVHVASEDGRWELVVSSSNDGFRQMSFVNGVFTSNGGKHVDYVVNALTRKLSELIKKRRKVDVRPTQIREQLFVMLRSVIVNPTFDSQTKDTLTTPSTRFGSKFEMDAKLVERVYKLGIVDRLVQMTSAVEDKEAKKTDGKKRNVLRGIPKLDDANWAGGSRSSQCTLILTEGDSAKTMAISGLSEVGRDTYGVFPLKGKVMNVKDTTSKRINDNEEIANLKKIMGLETGREYDDVSALRYGRVMIMTDADADGSHIKGLMFNLFHTLWPSLMRREGFLCSMLTPIVKVTKGSKSRSFYNLSEYEAWSKAADRRGWQHKYYKGLGTSTTAEAKTYFRDMRVMDYICGDQACHDQTNEAAFEAIDMAFNKKRSNDRKDWLGTYDRERQLYPSETEKTTRVTYDDFVHRELIHFSNYNLERSIPSLCDGLKRSQRKIMYCCMKRKLYSEIKVAQLAGYVSEHGAYHHGEVSLHDAIVGMAQDFVGSNNLNLLLPNGQFGSRIQGGKDAASPRYIHTTLNSIVPMLFPTSDDAILEYMYDDGIRVEPMHYLPIIPMVLVNGALGIGTGFSTNVPCYNPKEVLAAVRSVLKTPPGETPPDSNLTPWYRGYTGTIAHGTSHGRFRVSSDLTIDIEELPIGVWTDDFKANIESVIEKLPTEIKDVESHYTERTIRFVVRFASKAIQQAWAANNGEKLCTELKLSSTRGLGVGNMHLYDSSGVIRKYESVNDIVVEFVQARMQGYVLRKAALLKKLREDCSVLSNRIRFVLAIVEGDLEIMRVPRAKLVTSLEEAEYDMVDDSYDYLLKMPIHSLTLEKVDALREDHASKEVEIQNLEELSERDMWLGELDVLEKHL